MSKKNNKTNILFKHIIYAIKDMKGKEVIALDLQHIDSAICKYFIICTGNSNTHVNSIENKIKDFINKETGEKPYGIEGNNTGEWVLMDYIDIVVHVFQKKVRDFYNIENLWGDAKIINTKSAKIRL